MYMRIENFDFCLYNTYQQNRKYYEPWMIHPILFSKLSLSLLFLKLSLSLILTAFIRLSGIATLLLITYLPPPATMAGLYWTTLCNSLSIPNTTHFSEPSCPSHSQEDPTNFLRVTKTPWLFISAYSIPLWSFHQSNSPSSTAVLSTSGRPSSNSFKLYSITIKSNILATFSIPPQRQFT